MKLKNYSFEVPPAPTDKRRIVFSFGVQDNEFFKCFPSDTFLGTRYDRNPAQLLIVWDALLRPYHCELQIFTPRNQLLVAFPIPKSVSLPYTIVDGMINEWVTKEEYVNFQFVFTKDDGSFVKSTIPVRLELSPANRPEYMKVIKPMEFDRMKVLYDQAIVNAVLRFDEVKGWVYDCFSHDGTLRFSLDWIPKSVVQAVEQELTPNEKMVARANLNVPFTFYLPLSASDGKSIRKSTAKYVNKLEYATFEVWQDNGNGTYSEVTPLNKTYSSSEIRFDLENAVGGYVRVSCKSSRFIPADDSVLLVSTFSGNGAMSESTQRLMTNEVQDE